MCQVVTMETATVCTDVRSASIKRFMHYLLSFKLPDWVRLSSVYTHLKWKNLSRNFYRFSLLKRLIRIFIFNCLKEMIVNNSRKVLFKMRKMKLLTISFQEFSGRCYWKLFTYSAGMALANQIPVDEKNSIIIVRILFRL